MDSAGLELLQFTTVGGLQKANIIQVLHMLESALTVMINLSNGQCQI